MFENMFLAVHEYICSKVWFEEKHVILHSQQHRGTRLVYKEIWFYFKGFILKVLRPEKLAKEQSDLEKIS